MKQKTTISIYREDSAEWGKACTLAKVTSPEGFKKLMKLRENLCLLSLNEWKSILKATSEKSLHEEKQKLMELLKCGWTEEQIREES